MSDCKIALRSEKYPRETMMARKDFAKVWNKELVEPAFWFENVETGRLYYSVYGCIGFPQEVLEDGKQMAGYAAVVGVVKRQKQDPEKALFELIEEIEDLSVERLLSKVLKIREEWGYGVHSEILTYWTGDYLKFENVVAHFNNHRIDDLDNAIIVSPPDDYESKDAFDIYVRRLEGALVDGEDKRLYLGGDKNTILRNSIIEFKKGNPAVSAVGGLVHSLIQRQPWMLNTKSNVFQSWEE